eukprot:m.920082 g.920082  ORF g.920082 m.920082 type:complete len:434 (-) comp61084_c0_seq1:105-1406(-)
MAVNLNRNVQDEFYRYKMPPIIAKVEGKGNGIKTVIVNMVDIAKALGRPPGYSCKYFGCELGAQVQIENDRYIVNGEHEAKRLQILLDGFIKTYVLCANCNNPETHMSVKPKKEKISLRCTACGHETPVETRHKLTAYIFKNPPPESKSKSDDKDKDKEKDKKKKKKDKDAEAADSEEPTPAVTPSASAGREDDDDFGDDVTEDAIRERAQALAPKILSLTATDDLDKSADERLAMFRSFVQAHLADPKFASKSLAEADRLDCKDKAIMVVCELVLDSETEFLSRCQTYQVLIHRLVGENPKAQKYFLGSLEILAEKYARIADKFAHVLKTLYDMSLLEEEALLAWAEKVSKKYVSKDLSAQLREKAAPLINWLKEAEEEEEDEEDDGVEFEPLPAGEDAEASASAAPATYQPTRGLTSAQEKTEEDFDIDAI